ncbi:alpha/beta fold hydrolase [Cryptosporangium aurantiacum]|uniref:Pimeloyl-ACP methyl ester carboxylesterase n=1 Tax=Cryptosporangium aurantiacum TaxID=134849 RepID=A0A1M7QT92_9ACTN|nr:alpha/beta hydrolase [Cryptosporangium aurantiacum]SHN34881.1 Pimeloyl-ACP methyl ester carboxylesterase [Cryptosporangium aurantiacum]
MTRDRVLADLPATDQRIDVGGTPTAVLTAGTGPPVVLLHGPGEFAPLWLRVLPGLAADHRVIAPDLPGHGASPVQAPDVLRWLDSLVAVTCDVPPALVGRATGGALAARFAAAHPDRVRALVLVDTLGLAPFDPQPRFADALGRFLAAPGPRTYERLMQLCAYDLQRIEDGLGPTWDALCDYAIDRAGTASVQAAAGASLGEFGHRLLEPETLERIAAPTTLVWGRHDMATPVAVAEAASRKYGWPLHVIEDAADDPPLETPDAFLDVVRPLLGRASNGSGHPAQR